jgi:8-oxo-dGTP pyrophosphatase MutT (NUDIX family)
MNNNVHFEKDNYVFNYRVAAVIRRGDKILVQEHKEVSYYSLLGGRCEMGEDSVSAVKREIKEETGLDISVDKTLAVIENFFVNSYNNKTYHEMFIAFDASFDDKSIYDLEEVNNAEEGLKDKVKFVWKSIYELSNLEFKPEVLLDIIKKDELTHYINIDKNVNVLCKKP